MKKILITGASGRIGKGLVKRIDELFSLDNNQVSLLKNKTHLIIPQRYNNFLKIEKEIKNYYDLTIHLAANADILYCQKPQNQAQVIRDNIDLSQKVCDFSQNVLFISTDHVFNGNLNLGESFSEDTQINPMDFYGETKAKAEEIVLSKNNVVFRIGQMMGVRNKIIDTAKSALEGNKYFAFWEDNILMPSYFQDFFKSIKKLKDNFIPGIYHISCIGKPLSRSDIANIVLETYKEKGWKRKIDFLMSEKSGNPKRLILDSTKTQKKLGINFTDSKKAVKKHVLDKI